MSSKPKADNKISDLELELDDLDREDNQFYEPKVIDRHVTFAQKKASMEPGQKKAGMEPEKFDEASQILFGDTNLKDSPQKEPSMPKGYH